MHEQIQDLKQGVWEAQHPIATARIFCEIKNTMQCEIYIQSSYLIRFKQKTVQDYGEWHPQEGIDFYALKCTKITISNSDLQLAR